MSQEFFDIAVRLEAARLKGLEADAEERRARADLLKPSGLKGGDIVDYSPTTKLCIRRIQAHTMFTPLKDDELVLMVRMEGSPLTASGAPSKREVHKSCERWFKEHTADSKAVLETAKNSLKQAQ